MRKHLIELVDIPLGYKGKDEAIHQEWLTELFASATEFKLKHSEIGVFSLDVPLSTNLAKASLQKQNILHWMRIMSGPPKVRQEYFSSQGIDVGRKPFPSSYDHVRIKVLGVPFSGRPLVLDTNNNLITLNMYNWDYFDGVPF